MPDSADIESRIGALEASFRVVEERVRNLSERLDENAARYRSDLQSIKEQLRAEQKAISDSLDSHRENTQRQLDTMRDDMHKGFDKQQTVTLRWNVTIVILLLGTGASVVARIIFG